MNQKDIIIKGMVRRTGMAAAKREELKEIYANANDLYVFCKDCGKKRMGTLKQLQNPCGCKNGE